MLILNQYFICSHPAVQTPGQVPSGDQAAEEGAPSPTRRGPRRRKGRRTHQARSRFASRRQHHHHFGREEEGVTRLHC